MILSVLARLRDDRHIEVSSDYGSDLTKFIPCSADAVRSGASNKVRSLVEELRQVSPELEKSDGRANHVGVFELRGQPLPQMLPA